MKPNESGGFNIFNDSTLWNYNPTSDLSMKYPAEAMNSIPEPLCSHPQRFEIWDTLLLQDSFAD